MPKLSRTNSTVSGAVTRKVAPNTSAKIAIDGGDWSTAIKPNTATRAANVIAVVHTGPARSLTRPVAMRPIRLVSPIRARRLPATSPSTPRSSAKATTCVATKKSSRPQMA